MTSHSPSPAPFFSARHTPVSVISNHDNSDAPRVRFGGKTERARTASITTGGEHTVSGGGLGSEREGKKDGDWEDELEEDEGDGMAKLVSPHRMKGEVEGGMPRGGPMLRDKLSPPL